MPNTEKMADQLVELVQRLLSLHPKLVIPDERVAAMKQQLLSLKDSSWANPGDRVFLFRILAVLQNSESTPTMGELSAELGIPLSSATRMADELVRANFAERCADPNDRRIVRLCMTEQGRQLIELGTSFMRQRALQVLGYFGPDEQTQLLHLLNKLIHSLEAEKNSVTPPTAKEKRHATV